MAQILPQRIITPRSTAGLQSIWFQPKNEPMEFGVSLAEIVESGAEGLMVAPEEQVFRAFGLDCDEIQFSILVSRSCVSADPFTDRGFTVAWLWAYLLDCFYSRQRVRGAWLSIQTYDPKSTRVSSGSAFPGFYDRECPSCGRIYQIFDDSPPRATRIYASPTPIPAGRS